MANPLKWFRRHQKGMLVVFGVLLMASFGLASVVSTLTPGSGGGGGSNARDVVKWKGGTLTNYDLYDMRSRHFETVQFLNALQAAAIERKGADFQYRVPAIPTINTNGATPEDLDRETMTRFLLGQKADELGIVVGDYAVYDYLMAWADDETLTEADLDNVARELFNGRVDFLNIKQQLKNELKIRHLMQISGFGLPTSPSITEAWEIYKKMNENIDCSVMAFPVEDAMSQVSGSPSTAELEEIFNKGQYEHSDPTNREPGFKQRRRLSIGFMSANFEDFVQREMATIAPETVEAEYNRLAAEENSLVMELVPLEETKDDENPDSTSGDDDEAPKLDGPDDADAAGDESGEEGKEAEKTDDQSGDSQGEKGDEKGDDQEGDDQSEEEKKKDDQTESDGDNVNGGPRLSLQDQENQEQQETEKKEEQNEQNQGEQGESTGDKQNEESGDNQSNDQTGDQTGDEKSGDESSDAAENQTPTEAQDDQLGIDTQEPPATPQRRLRKLDDELAEQIKRRLATAPAQSKLEDAISDALADVAEYADDYSDWENRDDLPDGDEIEKPKPLDFAKIASKYQLTYGSTDGLVDEEFYYDDEFGKTMMAIEVPNMITRQNELRPVSVSQLLFQRFYEVELFRPDEVYSEYLSLNQHIFFALDKKEPFVPDFEDARSDVEAFWKMQQAKEIAKANAQAVVDEINQGAKTLIDAYPNDAKSTGTFSWYTFQMTFPTLPGVESPGEDFMKTAFALEVNKAGVAPDLFGEVYYVIQKTQDDERSDEDLQNQFFNAVSTSGAGLPFGVGERFQMDLREVYRAYLRELEEQNEVRWVAY